MPKHRHLPLAAALLLWTACAQAASTSRDYDLRYHGRFEPEQGFVAAAIHVSQTRPGLTLLDLDAPASRYQDFRGEGEIRREGDRVIWKVPRGGGSLYYRFEVDHRRGDAWDAKMTDDWTVLRLDDLFPPARSRAIVGAHARTRLTLAGPDGWSFESRYGPVDGDGVSLDTRGRRLDRPLGWLAAGELGIRRTRVADRRIAVAGPTDQGFRRMEALTFLRWTLPELVRIAPSFPPRLVVVGGSRDMWRGGLSGPGSLYVHPDRPLVSGNATSTYLHELLHVATEEPPAAGDDWIVEGLAEYYSLVILLRTGGISGSRFERSLAWLKDWADEDDGRLTDPSTGADTAAAALLFRDLGVELAAAGGSLDAVTGELLAGHVSRQRLLELTERALGRPSDVLDAALADSAD